MEGNNNPEAVKNKQIILKDLGLIEYKQAWDLQEQLLQSIVEQKTKNRNLAIGEQTSTNNYLIFCEHPHVYTLGKSGHEDYLLLNEQQLQEKNATYFRINRGGDITYHGPGQLVGYPIIDLDNFFTDIHKYLRYLEEVIILTLSEFGLKGERFDGYTGVWLDAGIKSKERKICAMGVRCSRWVTMHGFALNINSDLSYFGNIVPCGIPDKAVTSLEKELGEKVNPEKVKQLVKHYFEKVFSCSIL